MWKKYKHHCLLFEKTIVVIGVFGKSSYHAKNVPYLLQTTVLLGNGIYHTDNGL